MSSKHPEPVESGSGTPAAPFFDRPATHRGIFYGLLVTCAAVALGDLFIHRHTSFEFEDTFAFYAGFGFLAYLSIVNSAKLLRLVVKRSEDYYDR
jgi:hypothetical protein